MIHDQATDNPIVCDRTAVAKPPPGGITVVVLAGPVFDLTTENEHAVTADPDRAAAWIGSRLATLELAAAERGAA